MPYFNPNFLKISQNINLDKYEAPFEYLPCRILIKIKSQGH